jgi:hypothetical protein
MRTWIACKDSTKVALMAVATMHIFRVWCVMILWHIRLRQELWSHNWAAAHKQQQRNGVFCAVRADGRARNIRIRHSIAKQQLH